MTAERQKHILAYLVKSGKLHKVYTEENQLQADITEVLEMLGAVVIRELNATRRGVSDLIVCLDGHFIAIECKDNKGVVSVLQHKFIEKINKAGGVAFSCSSIAELLDKVLYTVQQ